MVGDKAGMWKLNIPVLIALVAFPNVSQSGKAAIEGVVNLNTASAEELQLLAGIGPARVRDIFVYRARHPFRTVEELARIKGIGPKTVRRLRANLTVSGPTTVQKVTANKNVTPNNPKDKDQVVSFSQNLAARISPSGTEKKQKVMNSQVRQATGMNETTKNCPSFR